MNDITIIITGMVLLAAPAMYSTDTESRKIGAAVAVNGRAVSSSYDIDIPPHSAKLTIEHTSVSVAPIELDGHRIQFGFDKGNGVCKTKIALLASQAASMANLPHINSLLKVPAEFMADARPASDTDYTTVKKELVLGWLDLPQGKLHESHTDTEFYELVEFRPSRKMAMLADEVSMEIDNATVNCVRVSELADATAFKDYSLKGKGVTVTLSNSMEGHADSMVPGIGYDYEILYSILKKDPADAVLPIPFSEVPMALAKTYRSNMKDPAVAQMRATLQKMNEDMYSATKGVNCGPAILP